MPENKYKKRMEHAASGGRFMFRLISSMFACILMLGIAAAKAISAGVPLRALSNINRASRTFARNRSVAAGDGKAFARV